MATLVAETSAVFTPNYWAVTDNLLVGAIEIEYENYMVNNVKIIYFFSLFVNSYLHFYETYSIIYCNNSLDIT